jgi:hypothetical protein
MHSVLKEFLSFSSEEKKQVLTTAVLPYETKRENIGLWCRIAFFVIIYSTIAYDIGTVISTNTTGAKHWFMTAVFYAFTGFSIFYWFIWCALIDAMRERIAEEREKMTQALEQLVEAHKQMMIDNIRKASGRTELSGDPISVVAATIEATRAPKTDDDNPAINPLRGALDGTLRPEHLSPPEDESTDQGF